MALWMVSHGAAMLLIAKTILPKDAEDARVMFTETVAAQVKLEEGGERAGTPLELSGSAS